MDITAWLSVNYTICQSFIWPKCEYLPVTTIVTCVCV